MSITIPKGAKGGPKEGGHEGEADKPSKDGKSIEEIKNEILEELVKKEGLTKYAKQVRVMRASDGIRIDLVDDADFSMFALGTTILTPEARRILEVIGTIVAIGHFQQAGQRQRASSLFEVGLRRAVLRGSKGWRKPNP